MYLALKPAKTRRNPPKPTKTDQKNALKRTVQIRKKAEKRGIIFAGAGLIPALPDALTQAAAPRVL